MSDLLFFITSNTDKYKFSCTWIFISCNNDVMNHVDCIMKCYICSQKNHLCSKNIIGMYTEYNIATIQWYFSTCSNFFSFSCRFPSNFMHTSLHQYLSSVQKGFLQPKFFKMALCWCLTVVVYL